MFNRKQLSLAVAVSTVLLASSAVVNAEIANDTATVTVQNAFTLASTTPIDFGVLRVSQTQVMVQATPVYTSLNVDGTQTATDGVPAAGDAATMTVITAGTPGRIDVTNAAPFTTLTVTLDATSLDFAGAADADAFDGINDIDLTTAGAGVNDHFSMYVSAADARVEGGTNDGDTYSDTTPNLRTDGTGAVGLSFGGRLGYSYLSTVSPDDGTYTGNYSVTVNY